ncbi:MAG: hypothetical protein RR646_06795 [Erysipelotrichaceae bacterium]
MKVKSISFSNYRCFLEGKLNFTTDLEHNMSVIIAPNGAGKTETLFSFWWVLYGFDFNTLRNKKDTSYALNSELYRELRKKEKGCSEECSVTLELEDKGNIHIITRSCEYKKNEKTIKFEENMKYSIQGPNGETSRPMTVKQEIEDKLQRIIPKTILNGIIFDGERMQKLSSTEKSSKAAINGVINDISNVELLERCKLNFEDCRKKYYKELKKIDKKNDNLTLAEIIKLLEKTRNDLSIEKEKKGIFSERKKSAEEALESISDKLSQNKEVKDIENERRMLTIQIETKEKERDSLYKKFSDSLTDCYLFSTKKLLDDVESIIENYKIPQQLTVTAVNSILDNENKKCICGRELDDEAINTLKQLIKLLPPDNINSTFDQVIRSISKVDNPKNKKIIRDIYNRIKTLETEINDHKKEIASLSNRILSIDSDGKIAKEAIQLETENNKQNQRLGEQTQLIEDCQEMIKKLENEVESLQVKTNEITSGSVITAKLNKKIQFVDKSLIALDKLKEINENKALNDVNEKISDAYSLLSEDFERGRQIRIIQYDENRKYQMVVYMRSELESILDDWKNVGIYQNKILEGMTEVEIKEEAILECVDSNSTGQSKINTFAFVKAILDFSNNPKNNTGIEVSKEYPLLIDAPFGDISSDNLSKSSNELHNFSKQIILLIDEEKFESLKPAFEPYICDKYRFYKINEKNYSEIERVDE